MSPRAAGRLTRLGFTHVYDFVAGKADWLAAGRPTERAAGGEALVCEALTTVATCLLDGSISDLADTDADAVPGIWAVIDAFGVVHGRLRRENLTGHGDTTAELAMEIGPTTVRADEPLDALRERMKRRDVDHVLVTSPEGYLLGAVTSPDSPVGVPEDPAG